MSKAFTKESDLPDEPLVVEDLALPAGVPNYVTPAGLAALRDEQAALSATVHSLSPPASAAPTPELARLEQRLAIVARRLESAVLVEPSTQASDVVRFGATVEVEDEAGETRRYRIVGVDEADARRGLLSWRSPIARALVGLGCGDTALVKTPNGESELVILSIEG